MFQHCQYGVGESEHGWALRCNQFYFKNISRRLSFHVCAKSLASKKRTLSSDILCVNRMEPVHQKRYPLWRTSAYQMHLRCSTRHAKKSKGVNKSRRELLLWNFRNVGFKTCSRYLSMLGYLSMLSCKTLSLSMVQLLPTNMATVEPILQT